MYMYIYTYIFTGGQRGRRETNNFPFWQWVSVGIISLSFEYESLCIHPRHEAAKMKT